VCPNILYKVQGTKKNRDRCEGATIGPVTNTFETIQGFGDFVQGCHAKAMYVIDETSDGDPAQQYQHLRP
jgi:hypothetical protein